MEDPILIQVDESDCQIGTVSKSIAHRDGILHRAFSIFIFTDDGRWLLQQRAIEKYHSGGLWTNACCGHPNQGEDIIEAAGIRLQFEMGMNVPLKNLFSLTYEAKLENGLIENEFDHILLGKSSALPQPNPAEVADWKYIHFNELVVQVTTNPEKFTAWFKLVFRKVQDYYLDLR